MMAGNRSVAGNGPFFCRTPGGKTAMAALLVALTACGESGGGSGGESGVSGTAQKGPFQMGGEAVATRLEADGSLSSDSVADDITENGRYELPLNDISWRGPALLTLEGTYFDETTANFSSDSRTLKAAVEVKDASLNANVNLYTHFKAERVLTLMADGTPFADAIDQAQTELEALTGITSGPDTLDLLAADGGPEEDSANLLLFSAASLSAGLDQAALDAIADDFADDGLVNGSIDGAGETAFASVQNEAEQYADLLEQARLALMNQYSTEPPSGGTSGMGWLLDPCTAATLTEPRVVCEGLPFYGDSSHDSGEFVTFIPAVSGHYAIELFGDPRANDDNTGQCSWRVYREADTTASDAGDSGADGGWCGVEDITASRLAAGREYYIRPLVSKDDDLGPIAQFRLSATRVSEGREMVSVAQRIPVGSAYEAVVGVLINTSDKSYYRFDIPAGAAGSYTISASGYPCGDGELSLDLYEETFNSEIGDVRDADACSQSLTTPLSEGTYLLTVQNWLGSWNRKTFRPAPAAIKFDLLVTRED